MTQTLTVPTIENLRKASNAVYLACEEPVAADISNLLKWAADEIELRTGQARKMRNALDMIEGAMYGLGDLTDLPDSWGEPRHRDNLGVTLKTNCGEVYRVCDALTECNRIINSDEYVIPAALATVQSNPKTEV